MQNNTIIVPASMEQHRLDAALLLLFPQMGLRGRRRLWESHTIFCNGRARKAGHIVRAGDVLAVMPLAVGEQRNSQDAALYAQVRLLAYQAPFAAFSKPAGLHSTRLAGASSSSVEVVLSSFQAELVPTACGNDCSLLPEPELVTRLDRDTSGILLAVTHVGGRELFRALEDSCHVSKYYYALVQGAVPDAFSIDRQLDTANRQLTRVVDSLAPAVRHTHIEPVRTLDIPTLGVCTLVQALIYKGARHQIRVHLAHAGYPIVGDVLYGRGSHAALPLHLHHWRCELCMDVGTKFEVELPLPAGSPYLW